MFSKSCKYGIRATLFLSIHSSSEKKYSVGDIASQLDVPKAFLSKTLQGLVRENLVSSAKGKNGGFYLSDENNREALEPIIISIDGPGVFSDCMLGLKECSSENPCPIHDYSIEYRNKLIGIFRDSTIAEIAQYVKEGKLKL